MDTDSTCNGADVRRLRPKKAEGHLAPKYWFVGTMKGVILGINPRASVVDITHEIPAGDAAKEITRTSAGALPCPG